MLHLHVLKLVLLKMFKDSKLYSILANKCPACHKGSFFVSDNPYKIKGFSDMHPKCDTCHENFLRETGYYYGAMYISYGLNVIIGIIMFLLIVLLLDLDVLVFLGAFVATNLLLFPWTFRTSRLIWINIFVKYRRPKTE